jgi:hypothetical protein
MPCCTTLPKQSKSAIDTFVLVGVGFGKKGFRTVTFSERRSK